MTAWRRTLDDSIRHPDSGLGPAHAQADRSPASPRHSSGNSSPKSSPRRGNVRTSRSDGKSSVVTSRLVVVDRCGPVTRCPRPALRTAFRTARPPVDSSEVSSPKTVRATGTTWMPAWPRSRRRLAPSLPGRRRRRHDVGPLAPPPRACRRASHRPGVARRDRGRSPGSGRGPRWPVRPPGRRTPGKRSSARGCRDLGVRPRRWRWLRACRIRLRGGRCGSVRRDCVRRESRR